MKYLRNKNAPPTAGLVQEFIDTAYDTVKLVADNLAVVVEVGDAIDDGTFENLVYLQDIDTFVELNAIVADEDLATEAYVDNAVTGLYEFMGGYDASSNTPDLTTSPNTYEVAQSWQVTAAGTFFGVNVEPGDQLTAVIDNPAVEADWSIVNRNIDSAAFATAEQGAKADTALQPGLVHNVSELINDVAYADDQTPAEIAAAYNTATPIVSQIDAETGTSTTAERWTAERVAQAAKAQLGNVVFVVDDYVAAPSQMVFVNSAVKAISITLPPGANKNSIWIIDAGHNASVNNITIIADTGGSDTVDGSATFILDQNDNFCNAAFDAGTTNWQLALSGVPDLVEQAPHNHDGVYSPVGHTHPGFETIANGIGTTFNFTAGDLGQLVVADNIAASSYIVPDALGNSGNTLTVYNKGAGEVTINMAGTDTLDTIDNNCAQGKAVTVVKIAPTVWAVIGGSVAP